MPVKAVAPAGTAVDLPDVRKHAPTVAVGLLLLTGLLSAIVAIFQGLEPAGIALRIHEARTAIGQGSTPPDVVGSYLPQFALGAVVAAVAWAGALRALEDPGDIVAYAGAFLGLLVFPLVTPFAALALAAVALASEQDAPDLDARKWFPTAAGLLLLLVAVAAIARAYNQTPSALALIPPFDQGWAVTLISLVGLGGAVVGASKALAGRDLETAALASVAALFAYPVGTVPALLALVLLLATVRGRAEGERVAAATEDGAADGEAAA